MNLDGLKKRLVRAKRHKKSLKHYVSDDSRFNQGIRNLKRKIKKLKRAKEGVLYH